MGPEGGGFYGFPPAPDERWAGEDAGGGCGEESGVLSLKVSKLEDKNK